MKKMKVSNNKTVKKKNQKRNWLQSRKIRQLKKNQGENNFKNFAQEIRTIISNARKLTIKSVNSIQVVSNFLIGQRIVEFDQGGKDRAAYGKEILRKLSDEITKDFGKGYSKSNLEYMRKFYLVYAELILLKTQTASGQLLKSITQTASGECKELAEIQSAEFLWQISQTLPKILSLSWSHYVFLMSINNKEERSFYEIEASNENWALKELKRQFDSSLYERLALSRNKKVVKKLSKKGLIVSNIKNPCVLELFVARQKRMQFDGKDLYVDLVFYNCILKCYLLIDLKMGELSHQDVDQMDGYGVLIGFVRDHSSTDVANGLLKLKVS